jgi:hypothetical protein
MSSDSKVIVSPAAQPAASVLPSVPESVGPSVQSGSQSLSVDSKLYFEGIINKLFDRIQARSPAVAAEPLVASLALAAGVSDEKSSQPQPRLFPRSQPVQPQRVQPPHPQPSPAAHVRSHTQDDADDTEENDTGGRLQPVASAMYQNAYSRYKSFVGWASSITWNVQRNRHEAMVWAEALDLLISDGALLQWISVEMMCRRLAGLGLADSTGDWTLVNSTALASPSDTLLPREELRRALRESTRLKRTVASKASSSRFSPSEDNRRNVSGRGNGNRGRGNNRQRFSATQAASQSVTQTRPQSPAPSHARAAPKH